VPDLDLPDRMGIGGRVAQAFDQVSQMHGSSFDFPLSSP
jgi:hypothetical protein